MIGPEHNYPIRYESPGNHDMLREMAVEVLFCGALLILALAVMLAYGTVMLRTVA